MALDDARKRMERLAADGRKNSESQASRELQWKQRVKDLIPVAEQVVRPLREAGVKDIYVDGYRNALVVRFGSRPYRVHQHDTGYWTDVAEPAELLFMICDDGQVRGFRRPFYDSESERPEHACVSTLGHPADVQPEAIADLTADFAEWATAGEGGGGLGLQFF